MQLSKFTDYAFRALLYLAYNQDRLCTVEELSTQLMTSEHHMKKVIHKLASTKYVDSIKGRSGGLKLGMDPSEINLGEVLQFTEDNLNIFVCFQETGGGCPLAHKDCKLKGVAAVALQKFIDEYAKYSLQDVL